MLRELVARIKQGHQTISFPKQPPSLADRFRGLPVLDQSKCDHDCDKCIKACPTHAIARSNSNLQIDLGKCLFCIDCVTACKQGAIQFSKEYRLAGKSRAGLIMSPKKKFEVAHEFSKEIKKLFGRSLRLRQVSTGGCNACEADANVLSTIVWDMARFGIQFVASPRHADGILVTGPVSKNMQLALLKTYEAISSPKIVIAMGACSISGGPYAGHSEVNNGVDNNLPVDLYIPGCPPHPATTLDGILRIMGRIG